MHSRRLDCTGLPLHLRMDSGSFSLCRLRPKTSGSADKCPHFQVQQKHNSGPLHMLSGHLLGMGLPTHLGSSLRTCLLLLVWACHHTWECTQGHLDTHSRRLECTRLPTHLGSSLRKCLLLLAWACHWAWERTPGQVGMHARRLDCTGLPLHLGSSLRKCLLLLVWACHRAWERTQGQVGMHSRRLDGTGLPLHLRMDSGSFSLCRLRPKTSGSADRCPHLQVQHQHNSSPLHMLSGRLHGMGLPTHLGSSLRKCLLLLVWACHR